MPTDYKNLKPHPYADIFPMIDGDELEQFKADIAANGLQEPIVLCDGMVLDGRNRLAACIATNTAPHFRDYTGNRALKFVLSTNLSRRHLTSSQRAVIALDVERVLNQEAMIKRSTNLKQNAMESTEMEIFPFRSENSQVIENKANQLVKKLPPIGYNPLESSVGKAANLVGGTNPRYVQDAKRIKEEAPELLDKVRKGEMTIPAAKRQLNNPRDESKEYCGGSKPANELKTLMLEAIEEGFAQGDDASALLARLEIRVGGTQSYLSRNELRNSAICKALRVGESVEKLANDYGLSVKAVAVIRLLTVGQ